MTCRDVVIKEGFTDRLQIPKLLLEAMHRKHTMHVQHARNTGPTGSLLAVNKASKEHPESTPPEAFRQPETGKRSATTLKRQLSFEQPGPVSDTKKIRYPK